ncbi:fibrous sheath-interacting protein 1 isoform X4 [Numida meleagris]|uniref:fibrous sheath-interacting protein 1 isoform X4 n=1 Tax=Numida meleagris TaxID=8996 RepID=UPI000B3E23D7|nr:fibrous sheath-interacting protein 1 isoform X4 [Numida meleagris]
MNITRGSLDKISWPASSSRAYPSCRHLSASMELLTPEPCLPKFCRDFWCLWFCKGLCESLFSVNHQRSLEDCCPEENKGYGRGNSDTKEVESMTIFQECALNPTCISNSDSGGDSTETQTSVFYGPSQGKLSNIKEANFSKLLDSEEAEGSPQIQAAIRKMNKLDKILAKRHVKERAVKKQGKEIRAKLWEELKSVSTVGVHEEIENTKLFLTLISSWQDTADFFADPSHVKEDETHALIFHTHINPEDCAFHKTQHNKDYPSEIEPNKFLNEAEKTTQNKSKSSQQFIKKNVELAKDSGKQIPMLEGERKRLIELLKDTEDGSILQDLEESLIYANRSLEGAPGEKILRDNKEYRDQQNRLKEIDHQLKSLERNFIEEKTGLSEQQLKTLLEECMQPQRTISNVTMPKSQESLSCGLSPPRYTSQDSILHSTSTLSKILVEDHIVGMLTALEKTGLEDKSLCVNAESEIPSYYISKALADSHLSKDSLAQTEEPDDLEGLQKMRDKSITEGYFMSRALNTERLKKPSFLGEPLYCISMNNEPSTGPDILSIPLQTKGDDTKIES